VLPVSEKSDKYAAEVLYALQSAGVRVTADLSGERVQAKIRNAAEMRIPYLLVVGPRDQEARTVSVRKRGIEKDLGAVPLDVFVDGLKREIATRGAKTAIDAPAEPVAAG